MTVKEYFEKYWFCNRDEERNAHGYDMPIVKCEDGSLLVCSITLEEDRYVGCDDWLNDGLFFYCLIPNVNYLDDNIYNYIPDLGDPVNINKLEEEATKHGGIVVDPEVLKYSFISKVINTFSMTGYLVDIVFPDLIAMEKQYREKIM